ncbi:MAG: hypothetical protein O3A25_00810 [Acidobacteria bacterium]|nr:hypothetical protein [Acidobacteriota bacterium]
MIAFRRCNVRTARDDVGAARDDVGAVGLEQGNRDESTMCSVVVAGVLGGAGSLNIQRVVGP